MTTQNNSVQVSAAQNATTFQSLDLPDSLKQSLAGLGFTNPTEIQSKSIPVALKGADILGSAQTGTGKTGAFSIPTISRLMENKYEHALILAPTRELALQVVSFINKLLAGNRDLKTALLIGGEPMFKQLNQLRQRPRIIVGTPGRVFDHIKRGTLKTNTIRTLILDEIDRMLDMGFSIQIEEIVKTIPTERQTLMFSATLPREIVNLSQKYLNNPVRLSAGEANVAAPKVKQEFLRVPHSEKFSELTKQLDARDGSIIVFVKTKHGAEDLHRKLSTGNFSAGVIHGDLRQRARERAVKSFRNMDYRILVATEIASRGLDIPHIKHVINYDLPQNPEDYIHRIGRTARAGSEGFAISLVSSDDVSKYKAISRLLSPSEKGANFHGIDISGETSDRKRSGGRGGRSGFGGGNRRSFGGGNNGGSRFGGNSEGRGFSSERSAFDRKPDRNNDRRPERSSEGNFSRPEGSDNRNPDNRNSRNYSSYAPKKSFSRDGSSERSFSREDRGNEFRSYRPKSRNA